MSKMTFADLIGTWPRDEGKTSIATFAADIRVPYDHAQVMRYRNSINPDLWSAVIRSAKRRGLTLTHDDFVEMRSRRHGSRGRSMKPRAHAGAA